MSKTRTIIKKSIVYGFIVLICIIFAGLFVCSAEESSGVKTPVNQENFFSLPQPEHSSSNVLDNALETRRSVRDFESRPISSEELSIILWAGQGITNETSGQRTAPSAMKKYPLTLQVVISNVTDIEPGVYSYIPENNSLKQILSETEKEDILKALGQKQVFAAPATIVIEANYTPFLEGPQKSVEESVRHVSLEAGHVVQNMLLMETSRGLAGTPFTGFNVTNVENILNVTDNHHVIYAMTIGYPKSN